VDTRGGRIRAESKSGGRRGRMKELAERGGDDLDQNREGALTLHVCLP